MLAYTNELAGSEPEKILADSDLDWAQDMKRLGAYLHTVGAKEVTFMPFSPNFAAADPTFPRVLPMDPANPAPGWNAVSISVWKLARFHASGPVWPDSEEDPDPDRPRGIPVVAFPSAGGWQVTNLKGLPASRRTGKRRHR